MNQQDSQGNHWSEDQVVEAIVAYLRELEGTYAVDWVSQGFGATFQALIRISFANGQVMRLGVAYLKDEEGQEAFDEGFLHRRP